jgi:hypothetical protein
VSRAAKLTVALERQGLIAMAGRERIARYRHGSARGLGLAGGTGRGRATPQGQAHDRGREQASLARPHRRFSSW